MEETEVATSLNTNTEDYSASATLIHFDEPIPLLRGPLPAGSLDDPSIGPFVLAFQDAESWRSAYRHTKSTIFEQCMAGARVGCSISAMKKCTPPWWKNLFGPPKVDFNERECCEERELSECLAASKEPCIRLAKEKCLAPFRDARIASTDFQHFSKVLSSQRDGFLPQVTNYRASVLFEDYADEDLFG